MSFSSWVNGMLIGRLLSILPGLAGLLGLTPFKSQASWKNFVERMSWSRLASGASYSVSISITLAVFGRNFLMFWAIFFSLGDMSITMAESSKWLDV